MNTKLAILDRTRAQYEIKLSHGRPSDVIVNMRCLPAHRQVAGHPCSLARWRRLRSKHSFHVDNLGSPHSKWQKCPWARGLVSSATSLRPCSPPSPPQLPALHSIVWLPDMTFNSSECHLKEVMDAK